MTTTFHIGIDCAIRLPDWLGRGLEGPLINVGTLRVHDATHLITQRAMELAGFPDRWRQAEECRCLLDDARVVIAAFLDDELPELPSGCAVGAIDVGPVD